MGENAFYKYVMIRLGQNVYKFSGDNSNKIIQNFHYQSKHLLHSTKQVISIGNK